MSSTDFDLIGRATLEKQGSIKWAMFPGTIGAFVAEMDFGMAPEIRAAVARSLDDAVTGYLPPALVSELQDATANWHATRYGWEPERSRIHPTADVIAAFVAAIEHFTRPGSKVIVPTPAYMPFLFVPPSIGREVIEVPVISDGERHVIDLEALDAAFRAGGELLVLCNPHNPLGTVANREELAAITEVVDRHGGRVFADEIHAPLVFEGVNHVPYASVSETAASHAITATSASKAWNLAGMKCAQIILSNDSDEAIWKQHGLLAEHGAANQGVVANIAAYREGGAWLDGVVRYLDGNRRELGRLVSELMPDVGYRMPQGTYIGWLDFSAYGIEADLGDYFREHAGVSMTDGRACGAPGVGHTRFIFALPRPLLAEAVHGIAGAVTRA